MGSAEASGIGSKTEWHVAMLSSIVLRVGSLLYGLRRWELVCILSIKRITTFLLHALENNLSTRGIQKFPVPLLAELSGLLKNYRFVGRLVSLTVCRTIAVGVFVLFFEKFQQLQGALYEFCEKCWKWIGTILTKWSKRVSEWVKFLPSVHQHMEWECGRWVTGILTNPEKIFIVDNSQIGYNSAVCQEQSQKRFVLTFHPSDCLWRCRSISAKPTSIKEAKDIPKLPENYKKLYQYFRLFHFPSYNNIAVIIHCFYK